MILFEVDISNTSLQFLRRNHLALKSIETANRLLEMECGIKGFFTDDANLFQIAECIDTNDMASESRAEYGDYQTNYALAFQIVENLKRRGANPRIVIEPTCGKGNFLLASLHSFNHLDIIYGIEIQDQYVWQTKFNILDFFLNNPNKEKPEIHIVSSSIFEFDYRTIKDVIKDNEIMIIGNPPWVTNASLSVLHSKNLPTKSNFKRYKGIDAMTGKGNFDIAEYITIDLLKNFGSCKGHMAFLVKNTVIKNILYDLPKLKLPIADIGKQNIDSKKEFGVNVDASLFFCQLNQNTELRCTESDFYTKKIIGAFGWECGRFMSDLSCSRSQLDGKSPFEWRQGIKHDCSKVMEISKEDDCFTNKMGERFEIEEDLLYPLLKSSDLKTSIAPQSRKKTIVTQRFVGQDTSYIKQYTKTFEYLNKHIEMFRLRKSSIYKGKSDFSIFGIGEYAFKPYKIAISGLYKTFHFCLIKPQDGKPVMLDDTCYFIGFDKYEQAELAWKLLNSDPVSEFLKSISFKDSKRMITKEVLMRIDLNKMSISKEEHECLFGKSSASVQHQFELFEQS